MQWVLQSFEDTQKLGDVLARRGLAHSWHKVVPFVGELEPQPEIDDASNVVLFGSYTLWRYAEKHGLRPGVWRIAPFSQVAAWQPYLLNGPGAIFATLSEVPERIAGDARLWFMRPVDDSKAEPGRVRSGAELHGLAAKVCALDADDIPRGSLRPETDLMLCPPAVIHKEWRIWVVADRVVTYSLYREGARVVYRPEIDGDALAFAQKMVALAPGYAPAYVIDICRTAEGLHLLETNCLNAAGFYAADLDKLVTAIEGLVAS